MQVVLVTLYACYGKDITIYITVRTAHHPHPSWLLAAGWSDINVIAVCNLCKDKEKAKIRWTRHITIILVNIIYFNCIIATAIIAMVFYNYQIPTVVVVLQTTTLLLPLLFSSLLLSSQLTTLVILIVHDLYSSSIQIQGAKYHRIKCRLKLLPPNP